MNLGLFAALGCLSQIGSVQDSSQGPGNHLVRLSHGQLSRTARPDSSVDRRMVKGRGSIRARQIWTRKKCRQKKSAK